MRAEALAVEHADQLSRGRPVISLASKKSSRRLVRIIGRFGEYATAVTAPAERMAVTATVASCFALRCTVYTLTNDQEGTG